MHLVRLIVVCKAKNPDPLRTGIFFVENIRVSSITPLKQLLYF